MNETEIREVRDLTTPPYLIDAGYISDGAAMECSLLNDVELPPSLRRAIDEALSP